MKIIFHPDFKKNYKKRVANNQKLVEKFQKRLEIFRNNRLHPLLQDHPLKGSMRDYRSYSVSGDIRIVYEQIDQKVVLFLDVGSHNQVY